MGSLWLMKGLYSNFADSISRNIIQKGHFFKAKNFVDCTLPSWQCKCKCTKPSDYILRDLEFWSHFGNHLGNPLVWGLEECLPVQLKCLLPSSAGFLRHLTLQGVIFHILGVSWKNLLLKEGNPALSGIGQYMYWKVMCTQCRKLNKLYVSDF